MSNGAHVPRVSVVIAACNAAQVIASCLSALVAQAEPDAVEVIVADCSEDGTDTIVQRQFPGVTLLHFDTSMNLAQLRGRAIARARGDIIAILDPYSIADERWLAELLKVHAERTNLVVGGAVELFRAETQGLLAWAAYINEYGMFMLPIRAGTAEILPGSNISYKRIALFDDDKAKYQQFWKTFVNWELARARSAMWLAPSVIVRLNKPIPFGDFLHTRFHHGRCFAGMRTTRSGASERWWRALTTPLLPALFVWRWGSQYWAKRRYRAKLILTLPLQFLLFGYWALGEFVGYLCGPGRSCEREVY